MLVRGDVKHLKLKYFFIGGNHMITAELIQPVVQSVTNNITAIVPAGLSILALSLGVSAVPKIIKKFF